MNTGTLALQKSSGRFLKPSFGKTFSEVVVNSNDKYSLHRIPNFTRSSTQIELRCSIGKVLRRWSLTQNWNGATVDLSDSADVPLSFTQSMSGKASIHMDGEKISAMFSLTGNTRVLKFGGFSFRQTDYQSKIHFVAPDESLHTAIILADLLFNFPTQDQSG